MTTTTTLPDHPRGGSSTWYEVLDVAPGVPLDVLRRAYEHALDLVEGRTLGGYFLLDPLAVDSARADIEAAWHVLSDPERRAAYDRSLGLPPITLLPMSTTAAPTTTAATTTAATTTAATTTAATTTAATTTAPATPTPTTLTPTRAPSLKFLAPVMDDRPRPAATTTTPAPATTTPPSPATTTPPSSTATTAPSTTLPKAASPPPFPSALFSLEGEVNGQVLKKLREARGLTLDQLSEQTKIRRPYLVAIEEQDFENLPARVYLRGFLTQIARVLRVDGTRLADGYLAFVARFGR